MLEKMEAAVGINTDADKKSDNDYVGGSQIWESQNEDAGAGADTENEGHIFTWAADEHNPFAVHVHTGNLWSKLTGTASTLQESAGEAYRRKQEE